MSAARSRVSGGKSLIVYLLFAANLIFGISLIAVLPPFELIDEYAHVSRIQAYAFGKPENAPYISGEIFKYYHNAPMPYGWIDCECNHGKDPDRSYVNYHEFFSRPKLTADYFGAYRQSLFPAQFTASPQINWENQHPPIYYRLMEPVFLFLAGKVTLPTINFILRALSFLMAFGGLFIGLRATQSYLTAKGLKNAETVTALGLLYPFLMPDYFWAYARVANDSLCLFVFSLMWTALLNHVRKPEGRSWLLLALTLVMGATIKLLLVPVVAGIILYLMQRHWMEFRHKRKLEKKRWMPTLKIIGVLAVLAIPIYLVSYAHNGTGSLEVQQALDVHNPLERFISRISWHYILSGVQGIYFWAVWLFGTWSASIIHIPLTYYYGLYVISLLMLLLPSRKIAGDIFWAPYWCIGMLFLAMLGHLLISLISSESDKEIVVTPGHYLHILAPCFAMIYGLSLRFLLERKIVRDFAIAFIGIMIICNFLFPYIYMNEFSGCLVPKQIGATKVLEVSDILQCGRHPFEMIRKLYILSWPKAGILGFLCSFILLAMAGLCALKPRRVSREST